MNSHYTYLVLNLSSVVCPLLLSFDKKVAFYKTWKYILPAILINALFFVAWDILFTHKNVWSFNPEYITGIHLFNLPIEEVLFFICVPYSCVFIYEVLNAYIKKEIVIPAKTINICLLILNAALCIFFYDKIYTVVNAGICFCLILYATYIHPFKNWGRFYLMYAISLIPFLICDGFITKLPIVLYNDHENMAVRIYTIPLEDILYCLSMLLSNVLIVDYLKNKKTSI